jgi:hypothetical protein
LEPGTTPAAKTEGFFCKHLTEEMKFLRWFGESVLLGRSALLRWGHAWIETYHS